MRPIYTTKFFNTSGEMFKRSGKYVNVQKSPHIYIIGSCSDSLAEKLSYTETRLEDISNLKTPLDIEGVNDTFTYISC